MLQDVESDLVERKESLRGDAPTGIREAVCAFANDLPDHQRPGVVFVGADDAGRPTGLPITDALLRQLADLKTDGKHRAATDVDRRQARRGRARGRGRHRPPRRFSASPLPGAHLDSRGGRGGPWRACRTNGSSTRSAAIARARSTRIRHPARGSPTWTCVTSKREYLPRAVDAATLERNDRSTIERLASMKMLASADDPRPTICGILILGKHPRDYLSGAYVQFLRIAGTALDSPIVDERLFDGPIGPLIGSLEDKLDSHNRTAVDVCLRLACDSHLHARPWSASAARSQRPDAPQLRRYEQPHPRVLVRRPDRDQQSGRPLRRSLAENFGQPGFVAYRNPLVAEAMRVLNLVQRWGTGLPIARRELRANQQPAPLFKVTPNGSSVPFKHEIATDVR